jgi:hypothetical protein
MIKKGVPTAIAAEITTKSQNPNGLHLRVTGMLL